MKIADQCSFGIPAFLADLFYGLPSDNPVLKPNKPVPISYTSVLPDKQLPTRFTLISLLIVLLTPFYYIRALTGQTRLFLTIS
jgi:hypothetical protein